MTKERIINFSIWGIFVLALLLRLVRLDYLELFGDEIDAGYQSYSLLMTGRDYKGHLLPFYAQSFSEWRAPFLMYAMVPFIKIFGLNEYGVRMVSVFFGLFSLFGFFLLMRQFKVKKEVAAACLFFLAICPWHIQYSRAAFELTLLMSLLFWGGFILKLALEKSDLRLGILSAVLFGMSFYTYNTANIYTPLLVGLILLESGKWKEKKLIVIFGILLAIFCLPVLKEIFWGHAAERFKLFAIQNNDSVIAEINEYRNGAGNTLVSKMLYNKLTVSLKKVIFNYTNAFSSNFLFKDGDVTFRHSLHKIGNLFWGQLGLIIIGIVFLGKTVKYRPWFWLALLLISPIPSSLTIDGYNHASRLFLLVFPLSFFCGLGMVTVVEWARGWKAIFLVGIILLLLGEFVNYQYYYWNFYKKESWRWWHYGYKQALTELRILEPSYERVLIDNTYEPSLVRYLFWNQIDPKSIFRINDQMSEDVFGYKGFCVEKKVCFVNFGDKFLEKPLSTDTVYLISHERQVGGDWNLEISPPDGIRVLKTVYNPYRVPIFYIITKGEQK